MKLFHRKEIVAALEHAELGGQSLHVWDNPGFWPGAPACFRRSRRWGHLFDRDTARLRSTARRFGVRRLVVSKPDCRGQHIDLCGKPLEKAMAEAEG